MKTMVWGNSAGGHLAEILAATNNNPKMEGWNLHIIARMNSR